MKEILKKHFSWHEVESMGITFLAIFLPILVYELQAPMESFNDGTLEYGLIAAVGGAVIRSAVKALWNLLGVLTLKLQKATPADKEDSSTGAQTAA